MILEFYIFKFFFLRIFHKLLRTKEEKAEILGLQARMGNGFISTSMKTGTPNTINVGQGWDEK